MSLTNLNFENEIDVRARTALISDLWTKDSNGEFFKVSPDGGGGAVLPSYLKPSSVAMPGTNGALIEAGAVTCGNINADGVFSNTSRYGRLTPAGLYIKNTSGTAELTLSPGSVNIIESGVSNILRKEGVQAANKIANLGIILAPSAAFQTVLYNSATNAFGYGTFPTPTTSQTSLLGGALPEITFGATTIEFTPSSVEKAFNSYAMKDGDRLVLVAGGGVKYNQWYGLVLGSNPSQVIRGSVISDSTGDAGATVEVAFYGGPAVPGATYTIPQYSTFIRLRHSGAAPSTFAGRITLEKVSGNAATLPLLTGTPV